jgi:peptidoglycan hydrolase-like protein with peptidoglycan-binding domain
MPEDLHDDDLEEQPDDSNVVKQLRRQARESRDRAKQFEEQAAAGQKAVRELEFAKAGIPLNDPKFSYFIKGYDGEVTAAAIQAEAQSAGLLAAVPDPNAADLAAVDRISNASQGAVVQPPPDPKLDLNALVKQATAGVHDPIAQQNIAIEAMRAAGVQFDDR